MQPRASTRFALSLACLLAGALASAQAPPREQPEPKDGPEATSPGTPLRPLPRSKNAREIRALIRSLGDARFEVREGARDRLYQIGEEAVPYLERASEDPDAERATAAGELLEALRWKVPKKLRDVVGEGVLDDFPTLGEDERLKALQRLTQRPHEVRAVGARYLVNVVRFDPSPRVRQAGAWIYLDVSEPGLPEWDPQVLEGLADEKESDGRLNLMRSRLLQRTGKLDAAIAAAKQAFELSPKSERIVLNLSDLYIEAGRFQDALPLVAAAEKIAPNNLRLRVRVGEVLIRAGEEELGLEKLASVLQTEAAIKDLELLLALGRAYLRCHKPGEALLVYKKAQKRFPLQYQLNVAVADVMRAQGNIARAVLVYLSEIRYASPGSARFEQLRERLSAILKEGGAEWLTREDSFFLDAQRGRQVVAVRRAVADWLAKRGMLGEAAEEARAACVLSPDNASLWLALGDVLRDKKDFAAAAKAYRRAQKLAADSPLPATRLRELRRLEQTPTPAAAGPAGFAFWDQRIPVQGRQAVSEMMPPPRILSERVVVPAAGLVDLFGLDRADGTLRWRWAPEPPEPEEGVSKEQYGMELVALVPASPAIVAAHSPRRARDPRPVLVALYNLYWRPIHRSWRKARFRSLLAYVLDPEQGKLLASFPLDEQAQVLPPFPVARGGRVLACASPRSRRLELELLDLVREQPLWRASIPGSSRRPVVSGERVLLAWSRGVLALDLAGEKAWEHRRADDAPILSAELTVSKGRAIYGTAEGELVSLSLADGEAKTLCQVGKHRLTGKLASGAGRVFVAERGGAVHAVPLASGAEVTTWTQPATKAAHRTLSFAGGKLFALNGTKDRFGDEQPQLLAFDPQSGRILFQRPIATPATLVEDDRLVVVASGGPNAPGGLRVIGASPADAVDARTARMNQLRSAAADALAEGRFEVAAIVARKYLRFVGSWDLASDDTIAFLTRILARSRRPNEARDLLHYAEERADLASQPTERWQALSKDLGLDPVDLGEGEQGEKSGRGPEDTERKSGEPKSGEPKSGEPKSGEPKSGEPKSGEPKSAEPKSAEPKSAEPAPTPKAE